MYTSEGERYANRKIIVRSAPQRIPCFERVFRGEGAAREDKILVVSSYHREYDWSRDTQRGFCAAMQKFGYFDNDEQAALYTKTDSVETSKVIVKKMWMDAKRKNSKAGIEASALAIYKFAKGFRPRPDFSRR